MDEPTPDLRAILAQIDRDLAESAKLRAEQNKLTEEAGKLLAEQRKLVTEERKMERDRLLAPLLALGGLTVGVISAVAAVLAIVLRH